MAQLPDPLVPKRSAKLRPLPAFIFMSRWLQLPLYLGLILAQCVYVFHFWVELVHLIEAAFGSQAALATLTESMGYSFPDGQGPKFTETVISAIDPTHKFSDENGTGIDSQSLTAKPHDSDSGSCDYWSGERYAIDIPAYYRYVDESFSFTRCALLDATGTETVQAYGVQAGQCTLNHTAYDNQADDSIISTWFNATTASIEITAGFATWDAIGYGQEWIGVELGGGFKAAVSLWTEYMSQKSRIALALRATSRDLYGHHRLGVPDYDPSRTFDIIFYDVRLKLFKPGPLSYKAGMTFSLSGTAYMSATDEAGNILIDSNGQPYSSIGRIVSTPRSLAGQPVANVYGQGT